MESAIHPSRVIAFHPNGKEFVLGYPDGSVWVFDITQMRKRLANDTDAD
jgi:hypothetical protein